MSDTYSDVEVDCPTVGHNNTREEFIKYVRRYHPQIQSAKMNTNTEDCLGSPRHQQTQAAKMNTNTNDCLASPRYRQTQRNRRNTNTDDCLTSPWCRQSNRPKVQVRMSVIDFAETKTSLILKEHNNARRIKSTK